METTTIVGIAIFVVVAGITIYRAKNKKFVGTKGPGLTWPRNKDGTTDEPTRPEDEEDR